MKPPLAERHHVERHHAAEHAPLRQATTEDGGIADAVGKSLEGSLARLRLDRVDIFHLHNAITETGGGEALSVRQVLGEVVPAFERLFEREARDFPRFYAEVRRLGALPLAERRAALAP